MRNGRIEEVDLAHDIAVYGSWVTAGTSDVVSEKEYSAE
jgi:hypothetical protein